MFGPIGGTELLLILVIALIVFGPRKLPEIGKSMGRMMAEFRRASNEFKRTIEDEVEAEKVPPPPAIPADITPPTAYDPVTETSAPVPAAEGHAAPPADTPAAADVPPPTDTPAPVTPAAPDEPTVSRDAVPSTTPEPR
jgi:TatA/E family protein of Tat protein translocase